MCIFKRSIVRTLAALVLLHGCSGHHARNMRPCACRNHLPKVCIR